MKILLCATLFVACFVGSVVAQGDQKRLRNNIEEKYRLLCNTGFQYFNTGDYENALHAFESAAAIYDKINVLDTSSLYNASLCANLLGEKNLQKKYLQRLVDANSRSPMVYSTLAEIYRLDNDSTSGLKLTRKFLNTYGFNYSVFLAETNIYLTFNNKEKAIKNLKVAIKSDQSNASLYFALGTIYDNLANDPTNPESLSEYFFQQAVDCYVHASQVNPDYFECYYNLGALHINKASAYIEMAQNLPLEQSEEFEILTRKSYILILASKKYLLESLRISPNDKSAIKGLNDAEKWLQKQEKTNYATLGNSGTREVKILMKDNGGVFYIPCTVNKLPLEFIFDTGASDVSLSLTEAYFMLKNGIIENSDFVGTQNFRDANGIISEGMVIILKEVEIGGIILYNVQASIVNTTDAPLLLGQSLLRKLGKYSIQGRWLTIQK